MLKKFSAAESLFTRLQIHESNKKSNGRRFTLEEKMLSLSLYKRSPKCYSLFIVFNSINYVPGARIIWHSQFVSIGRPHKLFYIRLEPAGSFIYLVFSYWTIIAFIIKFAYFIEPLLGKQVNICLYIYIIVYSHLLLFCQTGNFVNYYYYCWIILLGQTGHLNYYII